jgi:3',5'-cyclic-nucleotide phosphodiesterase
MLAQIQKLSSSFAKTSDGTLLCVRLHADAVTVEVIAVNKDNRTMRAVFDETTLQSIKDKSSPDMAVENWFGELTNALSNNNVTVTSSAVEVKVGSGASVFPLDVAPSLHGQQLLLESLLHSMRIRLRPRDFDRQLEELSGRENEVRLTALELEKEQKTLTETVQRSKEQDEMNIKRIAQLEQELAVLEKERRAAGADIIEAEDDEELAACRVRVPIAGERKDIDLDLFRLVKSKFLVDDKKLGDPDVRYCNVIRPMTTSELEAMTSQVGITQKSVIWECLRKIDEWDFDVFSIQQQMSGDDYATLAHQPNGGSLYLTTYALFLRHSCFQKFNLDERLVLNFLSVVEAGYNPNPYHNSMHAADVLHITHYILSAGGLISSCKLSDEDVLAALFAASIHDYNHPGINNSFHVKAGTYLATLYNDRSILENHHVSSVFELMKLPRFNMLSTFTEDQRRDIRDTIVEMVLATDMGLHAKILGQFRRRLQENHDLTKKDDVRLALSMAVKMADISNCGRPERLYLKWCSKIADEFYMQGDRERQFGMACSPFMDRMQPAMAKGQIAFMNYIVVPLFESVSELLPDMHFSVDYAENNKNYWSNNDDTDKN